ncbi:hypothetical protein J2T60_002217 [Natronospira proteinivora]|uniref:Uncharacterized protein n=1 Tax=Natronospira proteinivora TaxID=1807133 RepID=A0ABT1GAY9_9GAMM|nr:hypothetical protein [Natronospira proteinivora]MCP1728217.1 hypothetical protein [Natronospira proteinivora]
MKLKLNKEELVTLSDDAEVLGKEMTPQVGGGQDTQVCVDYSERICRVTLAPGETCGVWTCPPVL